MKFSFSFFFTFFFFFFLFFTRFISLHLDRKIRGFLLPIASYFAELGGLSCRWSGRSQLVMRINGGRRYGMAVVKAVAWLVLVSELGILVA